MRMNYGQYAHLTYGEARQLEAQRHVRILEKDVPRRHMDNTSYMYRLRFNKRRYTRVAWVQNYSKDGGAEISNYNVVRVGEKLGYDIVGCNIDLMNNLEASLKMCDIVIVNNMHSANYDEATRMILGMGKPLVVYSHDCFAEDGRLFESAAYSFFISPFHQRHYEKLYGLIRGECLPLAFNVDRWKNESNGRKAGSVLVLSYEKSRKNVQKFINENPALDYHVAGDMVPQGARVNKIPSVFYDNIHELYTQYETVLHVPDGVCAGDRVLFEAVLCGCKVITNENAGHASWLEKFDWRDEKVLRPVLADAPYKFWRRIDEVLVGKHTITEAVAA